MNDTTNPHERRAQALAEITQLQQDYVASQQRITALENQLRDQQTVMQREINRQEARAEVAERERTLYRAEAHLFRAKLVEMVTTISNVRRMTDEAEKIAQTVNSILHNETPEEAAAEVESAREMVASISEAADRGTHVERSGLNDLEAELDELLAKEPVTRAAAS